MLSVSLLTLVLAAAEPTWHTDYAQATAKAKKDNKDLLIVFHEKGELDEIFRTPEVQKRLGNFVCLRLPASYELDKKRLLDHEALADMMGQPGFAIISYHDEKLATNGTAISVHPRVQSRYRWVPQYGVREVCIILDLPATASLSQRSMIYAVSVHPEQPRSIEAECHPAFLAHAESHSQRQASTQRQHHANLGAAMNWLQNQVGGGFGGASEVVAESWGRFVGGENVLEAAFSCIDAWRHSPGHWGAVSRPHRYFGYDIAQAGNGTWYATGIFAD
jgi:hypothetical protein